MEDDRKYSTEFHIQYIRRRPTRAAKTPAPISIRGIDSGVLERGAPEDDPVIASGDRKRKRKVNSSYPFYNNIPSLLPGVNLVCLVSPPLFLRVPHSH
ncbi:hypothetical protein EVAR_91467_1 [Eumeta japonica]|uniref:Uncharacterized protein n=1 Tax=Eumeta variegata TaxID=151549 RepID=A0A4C1X3J5_EUMVA|nr:hypothetical protein EVAR_91467_1 [Eumeta japonica]